MHVLESGASALQSEPPINQISVYLDGFHVTKGEPASQMEAHHYCNQVNQDFMQCVLFDGNTADAHLIGVEYIISAKLYATLPAEERAYWHPHNYEVLSGELQMPGVPQAAERQALAGKIDSYGKTWHTWMSGMYAGHSDELPLGPPRLEWSFNHDGEMDPGMLQARDQRMHLSTLEDRRDRQDLAAAAHPQGGVDAMKGQFPNAQPPLPGVADNGDPAARPVSSCKLEDGHG